MEQSDILRNLQIEQLTPMQEAARDAYQSNKDLVLLSPTGSGKTLAFLLPLVQSLKADVQGVQAVVLVPSRELALQIETVFKSMNVLQGDELLWRTPGNGRASHNEGHQSGCHHWYSRPYERPFEETELRGALCHHTGD